MPICSAGGVELLLLRSCSCYRDNLLPTGDHDGKAEVTQSVPIDVPAREGYDRWATVSGLALVLSIEIH
jgi:hypothetical protein